MANRFWRGGAFTDRGRGTAPTDGDFEYDTVLADSNWVDDAGDGAAVPVDADKIFFDAHAGIVPSDYTESEPHVPGKHWHCCVNLGQAALDVQGIVVSRNFTGRIVGYSSKPLIVGAAVDKGGGLVGIPCTAHNFAAGDYVTLSGTDHYDGEYRIASVTANEFVITATYIAETFSVTDSATARTPLVISVAGSLQLVYNSNEASYIECGATAQNIPLLVFDSATGYLHISSTGNGNWDDIQMHDNGTVELAKDTKCTKIASYGNGTVIVGEDCGAPIEFSVYGGNVVCKSAIGASVVSGAVFSLGEGVLLSTSLDITKLSMYSGTFNWWSKGILTDYEQFGGIVKALGDSDKVLGSGAVAYPLLGGVLDLSQAGGLVSFHAGASINFQGGELKPPPRNNVTW